MVRFEASGVEAPFDEAAGSLLGLARRLGPDVLHSCEEGVCGTPLPAPGGRGGLRLRAHFLAEAVREPDLAWSAPDARAA